MANTTHGQFVWYDNLTIDPQAAIAFYTEVAGWKTQPFGQGGDYMMWVGREGPLGGVMKLPEEAKKMGARPHWMGNIQVADIEATVAKVKKIGGKVYKEPSEIPTVGRFSVIADPQGGALTVVQFTGTMAAHNPETEGEFCWNELMTTDSEAALKFYSELFGWKVQMEMDMGPMGKYRLFGIEGSDKRMGGMMNIPPGQEMPTSWIYYVSTGDLDAAVARATKRGAKALQEPMDVPEGRVAQLTDPQGCVFALHQSKKK